MARNFCRDNQILNALDDWRVLDIPLIQKMFFQGFKNHASSLRKCQDVMARLKIKRWKGEHGYVYGVKGQWEHTLMLNYIRYSLLPSNWEKVHTFQYEYTFPTLRADGFLAIKNEFTGGFRFLFIEVERNSDRNKFDKITRYNQLYESINKGFSPWWVSLIERFPPVLIVCQSEARLNKINLRIQEDNTNGLRFDVCLLDKRRCLE